MKLPISKRLSVCAQLVPRCDTAADVGTDHGYLGIQLLRQGICRHVIASDLREKPLENAKANAARFGVCDQMTFVRSDGLQALRPDSFQVLICAGLGGDCISGILSDVPWIRDGRYTLILQPQSSGNDLRRYLSENGFEILREKLVQDGRFLYGVMVVRYGRGRPLSPGEQYASPALQRENDPLYPRYLERLERSLTATVAGISRGETEEDRRKLAYYSAALSEIKEMRRIL